MVDLIVFSVGSNKYSLNIENIQRIIQANTLTEIPNAHPYIDGMMSHEDGVIKVLSFRKLIGLPSYKEELSSQFVTLKQDHIDWVESLKESIESGAQFTKTFDPHACELGKWIDNFTAYDDRVTQLLSKLVEDHKALHLTGADICEIKDTQKEEAQKLFDSKLNEVYERTVSSLDTFIEELNVVSNSLQKLLIYEKRL